MRLISERFLLVVLKFRYLITLLMVSAALVSQAATVNTRRDDVDRGTSGLKFNYQAEMDALQFYEEESAK